MTASIFAMPWSAKAIEQVLAPLTLHQIIRLNIYSSANAPHLNTERIVETMTLTIAEQLLYSTVKLTSFSNGAPSTTSTGFFMVFPLEGDETVTVLITNKHVIENATNVTAVCHLAYGDAPSGQFTSCTIPITWASVIYHPAPDVDLCALLFGPILHQANALGTPLFYRSIAPDLIPEAEGWALFDAIEDVTMIGCPRGITDEANNLPIFRRGITASALSKKYNGKEEFMVDMACFPGSSGSPIFLYDRNGYFDRKENNYLHGASRLKFVGILYEGPLVTSVGHLTLMHLGNAIRSSEIFKIEAEIQYRLDSWQL